jgi:two-component system cell cycle sensor histidine kinase/response regulator CckA
MPRVVGGAQTPSDRPTEAAAPPARGSETLLLVEDETGVRELTKDILLAQGYRVLVAQDGVEALQVAQEHEGPIHLLITDVVMPRLGGRELADQLRSSRPKMRVLYTSGYTDNALVHHGVLDEGVHFLSKPFELEALAHKVRDVLDGGDQRADGTGNH